MHNHPWKPLRTSMTNVGYPQSAWEAAALLGNEGVINHQVLYGQSHYTPGNVPPPMLVPQDQLAADAAAHVHYGQSHFPTVNVPPPIDQANLEVPMFAVPQQVSHMKPQVRFPMAQVPLDASNPLNAMHVGATLNAVPMMDSARLPMRDVARLPISGMQVPMKRHAPQPKGARVELSSMLIVLKDMVGPERWMAMGHVMHRISAIVMQHGHGIRNPKEMKRNMIRGLREIVGPQLWHHVQQQLRQPRAGGLVMRHSPTAHLKTARAEPIDPLVPGVPAPVVAPVRFPAAWDSIPTMNPHNAHQIFSSSMPLVQVSTQSIPQSTPILPHPMPIAESIQCTAVQDQRSSPDQCTPHYSLDLRRQPPEDAHDSLLDVLCSIKAQPQ